VLMLLLSEETDLKLRRTPSSALKTLKCDLLSEPPNTHLATFT
jgi:hypothetical protein